MATWYSPSQIKFSKVQIRDFILPNIAEMELGNWPPKHTVYVGKSKKWLPSAYFEPACLVAAEINARLAVVPKGGLLKDYYSETIGLEELSRKWCIKQSEIHGYCNEILTYITGWKRKRYSFESWKKRRENRKGL